MLQPTIEKLHALRLGAMANALTAQLHSGTITAALMRLLAQTSAAELQAAILEALQRNVPHPNAVRLALARRREQRGEPPPVGVELPAHLQARDTTVQPHALETYDQLKDKHDASADIPPAED